MSKSKELSEFDRGGIVGCHLCGKSVRVIANILHKPKSTVIDVTDRGFSRGLAWQDNCSIHTSRLAQTWFDKMGVQKLDSQSPDLNPIENLWDELERRLRSQPNRPSSPQALTSAVMDAWKAIPMVTYQKLVESLHKRVQAVIHAKGGPTSY
ncbi:transposable element Tcb1 transposase [Trichonephila clavipes]|nr:transposable element Tcb1 transposase [Trichonephila clavipes]